MISRPGHPFCHFEARSGLLSSHLWNAIIISVHRVYDLYTLGQKGEVFSLLPSAPFTHPPKSQHLAGDISKPPCSKWTTAVFHTRTSTYTNSNSPKTPNRQDQTHLSHSPPFSQASFISSCGVDNLPDYTVTSLKAGELMLQLIH